MSQTQRERALAYVKALRTFFPELVQVRDGLARVLDESQNPASTSSDGTMDPELWKSLRAVRVALRDLLVALAVVGEPKK